MRNRVVSALCIALILVGGAVWVRANGNSEGTPTLTSVEGDKQNLEVYDIENFWDTSTDPNVSPLSSTDIVARGLLTDYISLASSGQIDNASVDALVNQYINNIPKITTAPQITKDDLHIVEDSKTSFQTYDRITTDIQTEQQEVIKSNYTYDTAYGVLNDETLRGIAAMSEAYEKAAIKLRDIEVPRSLYSAHLKLVNNYFSTAAGMKAVASLDNDSMSAFSGMIAINNNIKEEPEIISELLALLNRHDF
jgi:hypothetical protein